jgi:hypothetical protein
MIVSRCFCAIIEGLQITTLLPVLSEQMRTVLQVTDST